MTPSGSPGHGPPHSASLITRTRTPGCSSGRSALPPLSCSTLQVWGSRRQRQQARITSVRPPSPTTPSLTPSQPAMGDGRRSNADERRASPDLSDPSRPVADIGRPSLKPAAGSEPGGSNLLVAPLARELSIDPETAAQCRGWMPTGFRRSRPSAGPSVSSLERVPLVRPGLDRRRYERDHCLP